MHLQYLCSNNVDNGDNDTKPNLIKQKPIIGHHRFCIEISKNEFDLLVGIDASTLAICWQQHHDHHQSQSQTTTPQ